MFLRKICHRGKNAVNFLSTIDRAAAYKTEFVNRKSTFKGSNTQKRLDNFANKENKSKSSERKPIETITKISYCGERIKVPVHPPSSQQNANKQKNNPYPSDNESDEEYLRDLKAPEWNKIKLTKINKNFYKPKTNRSNEEIDEYRKKYEIVVNGSSLEPVLRFDEFNLPESLLNEIKMQKFKECTPIQAQGIPIALSGKNSVGVSQIG